MANLALSTQRDTLEQIFLAQCQVPEPTLRALRQARELERELMLLRGALTASSAPAQSAMDRQEQLANLLSRVVLFRVALADPPVLDDIVPGSGQDVPPAGVDRALRG